MTGVTGSERAADVVGAGLLLAGLAALAIVSERWAFVAPWAAATLVAAAWPGRRLVLERGMPLVYLALPLLLLARGWPVLTRGIDLSLAFYQSLYLTSLGVLVLMGPRGPVRAARLLLVSGMSVAASGTDIAHETFLPLVVVWAGLALAALRLERPVVPGPGAAVRAPRAAAPLRAATLALGLLVVGGTVAAVQVLNAYYHDLNRAFYRVLNRAPLSTPGGFSGRADLGSIADLQGKESQTVALRAFGPRAPGYLRGRVFLSYDKGRWSATDGAAQAQRRESADGRHVLAGRRDREGEPTWRLHPGGRYTTTYFLPLDAAVLSETSTVVDAGPGEAFTSRDGASSAGYAVHAQGDASPWRSDAGNAAWRALPQDEALLAALDRVLAACQLSGPITGARGARAAVAALRSYFEARYRYHMGITFTKGRDPVEEFLTDKDRGHCELFAAAGTLLLRRLGLAARYTTGFVCLEKNAWGDQWLARNKDAHAWVEVLDPEQGWQTVELTPAGGVPAPTPPTSSFDVFADWLGGLFERVKAAVRRLDVKALLLLLLSGLAFAVNWVAAAWWRLAVVALVVAAIVARVLLRRRGRAQVAARRLAPDLERDRARLLALERALARRDLARRPAETLLEWADRLEVAPEGVVPERVETLVFVRGYAARRYARAAEAAATT